jgi:hypothetical protein
MSISEVDGSSDSPVVAAVAAAAVIVTVAASAELPWSDDILMPAARKSPKACSMQQGTPASAPCFVHQTLAALNLHLVYRCHISSSIWIVGGTQWLPVHSGAATTAS